MSFFDEPAPASRRPRRRLRDNPKRLAVGVLLLLATLGLVVGVVVVVATEPGSSTTDALNAACVGHGGVANVPDGRGMRGIVICRDGKARDY